MPTAEPQPYDARLIDEIVREVLARLTVASATKPAAPASQAAAVAARTLCLTEPVVSVATLHDRLEGMNSVVLPRKAVLTPAARDLLKERKMAVSYATQNGAAGPTARAGLTLVVGLAATAYEPSALVRAIAPLVAGVERLASTGLIGVIEEMCAAVSKSGCLGLLFSGERDAALCLANRTRGVRTSGAVDRHAVARAVASVGANLLVIDPAGSNSFQIKQAVQEFVRGGERVCPAALRERLG
jgi:hypothetical protein